MKKLIKKKLKKQKMMKMFKIIMNHQNVKKELKKFNLLYQ